MKIPRSWLTPALAVKRSAFALSTHTEVAVGFTVICRPVASTGVQSAPVLPNLLYCLFVEPSTRVLVVGKRRKVSRVGEYIGPPPAPATILLLVGFFFFH